MWSLFTYVRDLINGYAWFWWPSNGSDEKTILLVGLDDAGKTTLTGRLTQNRLIQAPPTGTPIGHGLKIGSTQLTMTDVGGHAQARRIWKNFMHASTRLVFMLDASNRPRFAEARHELWKILMDDDVRSLPILILGNKIDNVETACSETELRQILQIEKFLNESNPRVKLCMCSVARDEGFADGLRWLINQHIRVTE
ncbi:unnamed protein product [Adineta ricciae]|uniref:small monomeric GTPase n=1 Tax=Adineta ricciae TaxID=249248 RepID=A0A814DVK5_ADIRI|nr:unnamed protein product [Adineta ricciae]CAF1599181.1 unnamed protein product [Adineta ricciae]